MVCVDHFVLFLVQWKVQRRDQPSLLCFSTCQWLWHLSNLQTTNNTVALFNFQQASFQLTAYHFSLSVDCPYPLEVEVWKSLTVRGQNVPFPLLLRWPFPILPPPPRALFTVWTVQGIFHSPGMSQLSRGGGMDSCPKLKRFFTWRWWRTREQSIGVVWQGHTDAPLQPAKWAPLLN